MANVRVFYDEMGTHSFIDERAVIAESAFVLVIIRLLHGVSERPAISSQSVSSVQCE